MHKCRSSHGRDDWALERFDVFNGHIGELGGTLLIFFITLMRGDVDDEGDGGWTVDKWDSANAHPGTLLVA
jgi:hypothetical protein